MSIDIDTLTAKKHLVAGDEFLLVVFRWRRVVDSTTAKVVEYVGLSDQVICQAQDGRVFRVNGQSGTATRRGFQMTAYELAS